MGASDRVWRHLVLVPVSSVFVFLMFVVFRYVTFRFISFHFVLFCFVLLFGVCVRGEALWRRGKNQWCIRKWCPVA